MTDAPIVVEILRGREALVTLEPLWNELSAAGRFEPSTSFGWTRALLDSHLQDGDSVLSCVVRQAGRTIAIAPLLIRRERLAGPFGVTTLSLLSELDNTHSDLLGERDRADVMQALIEALASLPERWEMFRVSRMLEDGAFASGMAGFLASGAWPHRVRREQPSFLLWLEQGYEQFLALRSSKFRNHLRRKSRQIESIGPVRLLRAGHELAIDDAYRDLLAIDEHSWKHEHGTAITAIRHQQIYYRRLCEELFRSSELHLTILYLGERPVSYNLGLVRNSRFYYLKTSYDQEFRRASPATVHRARLIETLIDEGVTSFDFPGEPYQWEEQWTDELRWHRSVLVFNRSFRAALCRWLISLRDRLRRRGNADAVDYVDPRSLGTR